MARVLVGTGPSPARAPVGTRLSLVIVMSAPPAGGVRVRAGHGVVPSLPRVGHTLLPTVGSLR